MRASPGDSIERRACKYSTCSQGFQGEKGSVWRQAQRQGSSAWPGTDVGQTRYRGSLRKAPKRRRHSAVSPGSLEVAIDRLSPKEAEDAIIPLLKARGAVVTGLERSTGIDIGRFVISL